MLYRAARDYIETCLRDPRSDVFLSALKTPEALQDRRGALRIMKEALEGAQIFVLDRPTARLADAGLARWNLEREEDFARILLETPLPFPHCWIEFLEPVPERMAGEDVLHGMAVVETPGRRSFTAFAQEGGTLLEPLHILHVHDDLRVELRLMRYLQRAFEASQDYWGSQGRQETFLNNAAAQAAITIQTGINALALIASRGGPVIQERGPMMSRQERRQLERKGLLPKGPPPTVTRIRLSAEGREALAANEGDTEARESACRRAHWVRGHFMATARKGMVWRRHHIRGLGIPNETVRMVTAGDLAAPGEP